MWRFTTRLCVRRVNMCSPFVAQGELRYPAPKALAASPAPTAASATGRQPATPRAEPGPPRRQPPTQGTEPAAAGHQPSSPRGQSTPPRRQPAPQGGQPAPAGCEPGPQGRQSATQRRQPGPPQRQPAAARGARWQVAFAAAAQVFTGPQVGIEYGSPDVKPGRSGARVALACRAVACLCHTLPVRPEAT